MRELLFDPYQYAITEGVASALKVGDAGLNFLLNTQAVALETFAGAALVPEYAAANYRRVGEGVLAMSNLIARDHEPPPLGIDCTIIDGRSASVIDEIASDAEGNELRLPYSNVRHLKRDTERSDPKVYIG